MTDARRDTGFRLPPRMQLGHPIAELDLQRAGRGAAPGAVEQAGRALGLVALLGAAELPHGHVQCLGA